MIKHLAPSICFAAALTMSSMTHAACQSQKPIFSCTTTKGKFVEVCDAGQTIQYSFGKKGGKPEMALSIPRSAATTYQWDGRGSSITYSVQIPNAKTVYEVFSSTDRMSQEHKSTAGINVEINGQHAATLTCKAETVVNNIEGISLKPASWQ